MPTITPYISGQLAGMDGMTAEDNPYIIGTTKLGARKLAEGGWDWEQGRLSQQPARIPSPKEIAAAESVNVQRFRKR